MSILKINTMLFYLSDYINSITNTTEELTRSTKMNAMSSIDGAEVKKSQEKQE